MLFKNKIKDITLYNQKQSIRKMSSNVKNMSLFIPHVFLNLDKEYIKSVFENDYNFGVVSNIDFVTKINQDGKHYNSAYIHFEFWNTTVATANFQHNLKISEKGAQLMYDNPWFWIVLENKAKKIQPGARKPCIDISELSPQKNTFVVQNCLPNFPQMDESSRLSYVNAVLKCTNTSSLERPELRREPQIELINDSEILKMMNEHSNDFYDFHQENQDQYEIDNYYEKMEEQMTNLEYEMESEDNTLITIDGNYVATLEMENNELKKELEALKRKRESTYCLEAEMEKLRFDFNKFKEYYHERI